jgi:hypothetical protein
MSERVEHICVSCLVWASGAIVAVGAVTALSLRSVDVFTKLLADLAAAALRLVLL